MSSLSDREHERLKGSALLASGMVGLAAAAILIWMPFGSFDFTLGPAVGLTAAFFVTRLLTIRLPQGDEVYIVAVVGVSALAVTSTSVLLSASLIAGVTELVARLSQSTVTATRARFLDIVRGTAVLGMLSPVQPLLHRLVVNATSGDALIAAIMVVGFVYSLLDVLSVALQQRISGGLPLMQGIAALRRPLVTMYLVHLSMAAVGVRLYAASGAWAFPITLLLTLILQNSFNLYLRIRRGYAETISALAHAAELDRPHDSGHAKRVSDLAISVGRRLGMSSLELERLGYAALLHDIGRMGESEVSPEASAQRGAAIVSSIPFLADVAPLIAAQPSSQDEHPIGCEVVRACSRYDRLRADLGAEAALHSLDDEVHNSAPSVLEALRAIVGSQRSQGDSGI